MNIGFKQLHIKKPMHRVVILQLVDLAIVLCSFLLVHLAVFIDTGKSPKLASIALEILVSMAICCLFSVFFRVNRIIWRYAGSTEYLYLIAVSLISGMVSCGISAIFGIMELSFVFYSFAVFLASAVITLSRAVYQG